MIKIRHNMFETNSSSTNNFSDYEEQCKQIDSVNINLKLVIKTNLNKYSSQILDECVKELEIILHDFFNSIDIKNDIQVKEISNIDYLEDKQYDEQNDYMFIFDVTANCYAKMIHNGYYPGSYYDPPVHEPPTFNVLLPKWNNNLYKLDLQSKIKQSKINQYINIVQEFKLDLSDFTRSAENAIGHLIGGDTFVVEKFYT